MAKVTLTMIMEKLVRHDDHFDRVFSEIQGLNGHLSKVDDRLDKVDGRLDQMDGRFDRIEGRLIRIETDVKVIRHQAAHLTERVTRIEARLPE